MYRISLFLVLAVVLAPGHAAGQRLSARPSKGDYLFPARGKAMITATTGIPYLGIAELSYGVSDRFTVGAIIGRTPSVFGYGFRVRGIVSQKGEKFRVFAKMPAFYYPATDGLGGEPWILAWPSVHAEWKYPSGMQISLGVGMVGSACVNGLFGESSVADTHTISGHENVDERSGMGFNSMFDQTDEHGFMGDLSNTVSVGISIPTRFGVSFRADLSAVMKGYRLAGSEWIGGPPVILNLGVSRSL